jgi:hypothetical protein
VISVCSLIVTLIEDITARRQAEEALRIRRSTEYTSLRQDGTTVPVEASSVVIRDAAGQPKAVMAVIRDITQRKRAEEALPPLGVSVGGCGYYMVVTLLSYAAADKMSLRVPAVLRSGV